MNKAYAGEYPRLEREHWWFKVRQKIIKGLLQEQLLSLASSHLQVLNIGVAGGASSELLSGFGNVTSVETEQFFIEYLRTKGVNVIEASILQLPFTDNSFDLVCAFDVIEHVEDDQLAMEEMARVCKPGGSVCLTVPAFNFLWSSHDVANGHQRRYNKRGLLALQQTQPQLQPIVIKYFNSILFIPIFFARKLSNVFQNRQKIAQSDFSNFKTRGIANRILQQIFGLEVTLLKYLSFPFGVSLISFLKKKKDQ